jgi:hypothetical protein
MASELLAVGENVSDMRETMIRSLGKSIYTSQYVH